MKLANNSARLLAGLAVSFCLVSGSWAQTAPAKKTTHKKSTAAGAATVQVTGTVSSPNGMLAVVANPDQRVYFLREGDKLYDGDVEKIGLDGVTFKENSKDAFGKPVERTVTKRIYPSAGEQQ